MLSGRITGRKAKEDDMKKQWITASCFALALGMLSVAPAAWAGDYGTQSASKFARGIANLTTGWLEVPKNIGNESHRSNAGVGITYGTLKGGVHTVGRTLSGAFDTATFFVPSGSFVHSDYVWSDYNHDTTYGAQ